MENGRVILCFVLELLLHNNTSGFIQKHENEIPGLFQDNSRTFFSVDSISLIFSQFLIVFAGNGDSETCHTSFLSPEYFHYGIDKYRDYR